MKLFTAAQIRDWDAYTIEHEPIVSIDLMERAANKCFEWIHQKFASHKHFALFCGMGNNGGDGLVIARLLANAGKEAKVYILKTTEKGSPDFETNLARLKETQASITEISTENDFPKLNPGDILIDALFGTGISRPLDGIAGATACYINSINHIKISIDVPSGLPADFVDNYSDYLDVVCCDYLVTFQTPKVSFLFPEKGKYTGEMVVLDIGLSKEYEEKTPSDFHWVTYNDASKLLKRRGRFSHKGTYGHALIIGGSKGKGGAVLLSSKACLKAGAGLVTAFVPQCVYNPLQSYAPEVMADTITHADLLDFLPKNTEKYNAIGVGPGMGTQTATRAAFKEFLKTLEGCKMVFDADALNCLSLEFKTNKKIQLPPAAILTPHPKEFDRMFGDSLTSWERLVKQVEAAKTHGVYIVLKGTHTSIATPTGEVYFNSTGNPGMASGGSGDVLTGIITSLLAQGYFQLEACLLGVYIHGLAGELAMETESYESLTAGDIINNLGKAFKMCLRV